MVEATPIEAVSSKVDSTRQKPAAEARKGNIALDVDRPLFEQGNNWDFQAFKNQLLDKSQSIANIGRLPELKFLDGLEGGTDQDSVVVASYPRSGNTLLRAYLEKITGLVSGSDCDITKKLNQALMHMGLAGEGLVDKRVWVVKTHYPERYGKTKFGAERCILLVRSPLDCVTSLFNMVCSGSHDLSIADNDFEKFPNHWAEFIQQEITVWKDFHDFWLKAKTPVHIIRYEDIVLCPKPTLAELVKFILNVNSIEGTRVEKYIDLACQENAPEVYKPRKGKVNANMLKFKPMHLDFMYNYARELIDKFGYEQLFQTRQEENASGVITFVPCHTSMFTQPIGNNAQLRAFNADSLQKSMYNLYESDEVTSIMINYPALLLRKKSALYPEGRTSYRFKHALRRQVTVNGQSMFGPKKKKVKRPAAPIEIDQPETDETHTEEAAQKEPTLSEQSLQAQAFDMASQLQ